MKKRFILMLHLETDIEAQVSTGDEETDRFYNELLQEVMKRDNMIGDLYKLSITTGFSGGHNIFELSSTQKAPEKNKEFNILRPALDKLPDDTKVYFLKIFDPANNNTDDFFDCFFSRLGTLKIRKMNLIHNPTRG